MGRTRQAFLLAFLVLLGCASSGFAEPQVPPNSLRWVPADACVYEAFFGAQAWNKAVFESNAWKRFITSPLGKALRAQKDDEPIQNCFPYGLDWLSDLYAASGLNQNKQAAGFVDDLLGDEVFYYGTAAWKDWAALFDDLHPYKLVDVKITGGPLQPKLNLWIYMGAGVLSVTVDRHSAMFGLGVSPSAGRTGKPQWRKLVVSLAKAKKLGVPEMIIGCKVKDTKEAQKRLDHLVKLWKKQVHDFPDLQPKTASIAGLRFYKLSLDGQKIPWDILPLPESIKETKNWDRARARLNKLKVTLALGVRDGYLLVGVGETTRGLEQLGTKPRLIDSPEMKALKPHLNRQFISVVYSSAETERALAEDKKAVDYTFRWLLGLLSQAGLPDELTSKLRKDLLSMSQDLRGFLVEPGARLSFACRTPRGMETYSYNWAKDAVVREQRPLHILEHVGGTPLFLWAGRTHATAEKYRILTRWLTLIHRYVEEFALPALADEESMQRYHAAMRKGMPVLAQLDAVSEKMLLPALADGQFALVVDSHLTSRQWHRDLPKSAVPLPLPEPALVVGVADPALLRNACRRYLQLGNGLLALADDPEIRIVPPKVHSLKAGQMFSYPHLSTKLDRRIVPNAMVNDRLAVAALSKDHSRRLLASTPLTIEHLLPSGKQPVLGVLRLDWTGIMRMAERWLRAETQVSDDSDVDRHEMDHTLKLLHVLQSYAAVTYVEDGAVVTRTEVAVKDIED